MNIFFSKDVIATILSFVFVFIFIGIAELLRHKKLLGTSTTRKIIHIGVSHWWLFAMLFIDSIQAAIVGPLVFIVLNALSIKFQLFKGMDEHSSTRNLGTVYFPISLFVLVVLAWSGIMPKWVAGTGILVMGWGDGLAALLGEKIKSPAGKVFGGRKSLAGTSTMAIASGLVVLIFILVFDQNASFTAALYRALGTALVAAFLETATPFGIDNITVPLGTAFYFYYISALPLNGTLVIGFIFAGSFAYIAWYRNQVSCEGALAGLGTALLILASSGVNGLIILFAFFISSSILGKINRNFRNTLNLDLISQKGSRRDSLQVLANCGFGLFASILYAIHGHPLYLLAFGVSFAAASADTWASELGVLNRKKPVSILTFQQMELGLSGAISPLGLIASAAGSFFIAFLAMLLFRHDISLMSNSEKVLLLFLIALGGLSGSLIDSLFGATLQAQYRCAKTGITTEHPKSGEIQNQHIRGLTWMTNDLVNFLSIGIAVTGSSIMYLLINKL